MIYTYDLGDNWEHGVVLEKRLPAEPHTTYPILRRWPACLPAGGLRRVHDLLDALNDPSHPRHQELCDWSSIPKPFRSIRSIGASQLDADTATPLLGKHPCCSRLPEGSINYSQKGLGVRLRRREPDVLIKSAWRVDPTLIPDEEVPLVQEGVQTWRRREVDPALAPYLRTEPNGSVRRKPFLAR